MDSSLRLSAASGRPIPVAADVSPQDKREKTKRFQSFFSVHEHPPSTLFKDFKRHFRATIAYGPGFVKIQSKTKADQMANLQVSDLKRPELRGNTGVVYLRNNDPKGAWSWIEIKPETPNMAATLVAELEAVSWKAGRVATGASTPAAVTGPTAAAAAAAPAAANSVVAGQIPAVPATVAVATRATTTAEAAAVVLAVCVATTMEHNNTVNDGFKAPLASPLAVSTAPNGNTIDSDCQLIEGMKMRIILNRENPSENSVIAPSISTHRPMITVKRENVNSSANHAPTQQMEAERSDSRAASAARALQFGEGDEQLQSKESESEMATRPESSSVMDRLLQQQQLQNVLGQFNNSFAVPVSPSINVDTEASFMTPAQSPLPGLQQLESALAAGLNNTQNTDLNAIFSSFNGSGDGYRGASMPLGNDLMEYRMMASEFQQLLDRFWSLPEEKRRLCIETTKAVVNLAVGGFV